MHRSAYRPYLLYFATLKNTESSQIVKRHKLKDIGQVLKGALEYLTGSVGEELFNMVLIKNAKIKQEELLVKLSSKVINCKAPGAPALISFLHFIEVGRLVLIIAIDGISITITGRRSDILR